MVGMRSVADLKASLGYGPPNVERWSDMRRIHSERVECRPDIAAALLVLSWLDSEFEDMPGQVNVVTQRPLTSVLTFMRTEFGGWGVSLTFPEDATSVLMLAPAPITLRDVLHGVLVSMGIRPDGAGELALRSEDWLSNPWGRVDERSILGLPRLLPHIPSACMAHASEVMSLLGMDPTRENMNAWMRGIVSTGISPNDQLMPATLPPVLVTLATVGFASGVRALLGACDLDLDIRDARGVTPLMAAVSGAGRGTGSGAHIGTVGVLLNAGAQTNAVDEGDEGVLHHLLRADVTRPFNLRNMVVVMEMVLARGPVHMGRNLDGKTPIDLLRDMRNMVNSYQDSMFAWFDDRVCSRMIQDMGALLSSALLSPRLVPEPIRRPASNHFIQGK